MKDRQALSSQCIEKPCKSCLKFHRLRDMFFHLTTVQSNLVVPKLPSRLPSFKIWETYISAPGRLIEQLGNLSSWGNAEARWRWLPRSAQDTLLRVKTCPVSKGHNCETLLGSLLWGARSLTWNKREIETFHCIAFPVCNITHSWTWPIPSDLKKKTQKAQLHLPVF